MKEMEERMLAALAKTMKVQFANLESKLETLENRLEEMPELISDSTEDLKGSGTVDSPISILDEIKNARSKNEAEILMKILTLADAENGDKKKALIDINIIARKRLIMLEVADTIGWDAATAYATMFPGDLVKDPKHLIEAVGYADIMARKKKKENMGFQRRMPSATVAAKSSATSSEVKSAPKAPVREYAAPAVTREEYKSLPPRRNYSGKLYGSCFRCGGEGHWAKDCPTKRD